MSLKARRLLYLSFIIIFLLTTPLLIFYATGYKLNLAEARIVKTGALIINSKPAGAKIYLNDKVRQTFLKKILLAQNGYLRTPAKIKNLLPGEYEIKLELDGYWPWQKKLTINPSTSTYAEDIFLFKKNLPVLLAAGKFTVIEASPDSERLALIGEDKIKLLNLAEENWQETAITNATSTSALPANRPDTAAWSNKGKWILVNRLIINSDQLEEQISLPPLALNTKWDLADNDIIYYQENNKIISYNLANQNHKFIFNQRLNQELKKNASDQASSSPASSLNQLPDKTNSLVIDLKQLNDYLIKDNYLYLIGQQNNKTKLIIAKLNSLDLVGAIDLPDSADYAFINHEQGLLNLYDGEHDILYLIDVFNSFSPLEETISNVKYSYWADDNRLLYANDFEIWLYRLPAREKFLLTRISQPVSQIIWHPSGNYLIYSTNNGLYSLELDQREKHNITELIKLDALAYPVINRQGGAVYFYAKIGRQEGLYKLNIQ